jgi:DNA mismatch repair protein MutS
MSCKALSFQFMIVILFFAGALKADCSLAVGGIYQKIATENSKAIPLDFSNFNKRPVDWIESLEEQYQEQLHPPAHIKMNLVYNFLAHYEKLHKVEQTHVLDEKSWQDLALLCGSKKCPYTYLAQKIDRTVTDVGKVMLYRKLVQPSTDLAYLKEQQTIVKELIKDEELFKDLHERLSRLKTPENIFLTFWQERDSFDFMVQDKLVSILGENHIHSIKSLSNWLNTSELALEINELLSIGKTVISTFSVSLSAVALPLYGISTLLGKKVPLLKSFNNRVGLGGWALFTVPGALFYALNRCYKSRLSKGAEALSAGLIASRDAWSMRNQLRYIVTVRRLIQAKLMQVATYCREVQAIYIRLKQYPTFSALIPQLEALNIQSNTELQRLLSTLETDTFKGEPSFFSHIGRIISAYKLMAEHKSKFTEALGMLGELDAYMSVARLYKEYEKERVTFCFPSYVESEKPHVSIQDFWHPIIDKDVVVPNSLELGTHTPRNIVITGPNAGGKSTIMKALIINILLAQSIGIAPARELIVTPFHKITTYLNIVDDIATGDSLFEAGAVRAQELLSLVKEMHSKGLCFIAIDEAFNGTNYYAGQSAAYVLIKELGMAPHTMCVTPSHFPVITQLENKTGLFTNYKVSAVEHETGLQYPYKLEKGISEQIIAFKILKEKGYSPTFIEEAERMLKDLKNPSAL